jgi:hypothetical protein
MGGEWSTVPGDVPDQRSARQRGNGSTSPPHVIPPADLEDEPDMAPPGPPRSPEPVVSEPSDDEALIPPRVYLVLGSWAAKRIKGGEGVRQRGASVSPLPLQRSSPAAGAGGRIAVGRRRCEQVCVACP